MPHRPSRGPCAVRRPAWKTRISIRERLKLTDDEFATAKRLGLSPTSTRILDGIEPRYVDVFDKAKTDECRADIRRLSKKLK